MNDNYVPHPMHLEVQEVGSYLDKRKMAWVPLFLVRTYTVGDSNKFLTNFWWCLWGLFWTLRPFSFPFCCISHDDKTGVFTGLGKTLVSIHNSCWLDMKSHSSKSLYSPSKSRFLPRLTPKQYSRLSLLAALKKWAIKFCSVGFFVFVFYHQPTFWGSEA